MQFRASFLFFLLIAVVANVTGSALEAAQGGSPKVTTSVWGGLFAPASVRREDRNNAKFELYIKPAITVLELSKNTSLSAYSIFGLLRDDQKHDYNNKAKVAVGLELKHRLSAAIGLSFGAQIAAEHMLYSGENNAAPVVTADLSLYKSWKPVWLLNLKLPKATLLLSGWANFRYPGALSKKEQHNFLAQGSLKVSVRQPVRGTRFTLAPFAALAFKTDRKKRPWNNTIEPSVGIDLKTPIGKSGELTLGVKSSLQFRYLSGERQSGVVGYLGWYKRF